MVNTRILEKRLGWRSGDNGDEPVLPLRSVSHTPLLQGRVEPAQRGGGPRRASVEEAWGQLPMVMPDVARLAPAPAIGAPAFDRASATGAAMDQLRTQLLRVITPNGWRRIGVTSATRGAGRSYVSAALAASIARLDTVRVLLIDMDLEEPTLHRLLGIDAPGPLDAVLSGECRAERHLLRVGGTLALALNAAAVPGAADRMLAPDVILALRAMIDALAPDLVIHDMPPLIDNNLAQALLPQLDAVLLVADGTRDTAQDIIDCERLLEGQVPLLGVALNKSEDRDPRHGARRRG